MTFSSYIPICAAMDKYHILSRRFSESVVAKIYASWVDFFFLVLRIEPWTGQSMATDKAYPQPSALSMFIPSTYLNES